MQRERVSWIVVTYNNIDLTMNCVESIRRSSANRDDEIIVLDDGSNRVFRQTLSHRLPQNKCDYVYCDRKDRPMLAHLRGIGRDMAKSDWIIWIDNDARLDSCISPNDIIEKLQKRWSEIDNLGAIQATRYTPRGTQGANKFDRNLTYVGTDSSNPIARAMYPDGCFWMSHRSTFDKWSFRDDLSCFEDSCLGLQMYANGLSIYCDNTVGVYHKVWASGLWKYALDNPQYRDTVISEYKEEIDRICTEFGT